MRNPEKRLGGAKWLALAACALAWTGCSRNLMTPPSRIGEFETPKSLARGEKSVTLSAGGNAGIFYTVVAGASLQARKGLGDGQEVGFDASVLKAGIGDGARIVDEASPYIYSINSRFKINPPGAERWFSAFGGLGFGYSEPATFMTTEAGFSLGWENAYLIPYAGGKGTADIPIKSKSMDLRSPGDVNEEPYVPHRAPLTLGAMGFAGLKLPFPFTASPASGRPALIIETQYSQFWTREFTPGFIGGRAALQFPVRL